MYEPFLERIYRHNKVATFLAEMTADNEDSISTTSQVYRGIVRVSAEKSLSAIGGLHLWLIAAYSTCPVAGITEWVILKKHVGIGALSESGNQDDERLIMLKKMLVEKIKALGLEVREGGMPDICHRELIWGRGLETEILTAKSQ